MSFFQIVESLKKSPIQNLQGVSSDVLAFAYPSLNYEQKKQVCTLASPEILAELMSVHVYEKDQFDIEAFDDFYLACKNFAKLDRNLLVRRIQDDFLVYVNDGEDDEYPPSMLESLQSLGLKEPLIFPTEDNLYFLVGKKPKQDLAMDLIHDLYLENVEYAREFLSFCHQVPEIDVDEQVYNECKNRSVDAGVPPYFESIGIYAVVDPEIIFSQIKNRNKVDTKHFKNSSFAPMVIEQQDVDAYELSALIRKIMSARQLWRLGQLDKSMMKLNQYIKIGVSELQLKLKLNPKQLFARVYLEDIFKYGYCYVEYPKSFLRKNLNKLPSELVVEVEDILDKPLDFYSSEFLNKTREVFEEVKKYL